MEPITLPLYDIQGKEIDTIKLDPEVFDGVVNVDVIHQAINAYRANQRKGLAATKTRGEVSGGGKKPWKQKGTGRARVGSTRSPLWRHGGVVFGPHPRDFSVVIPKKIKKLALKSALCSKVNERNIKLIDSFSVDKPKTKDAIKLFANLKIGQKDKILLLMDKVDNNLKLALRNIAFVNVDIVKDVNVYEVLSAETVLMNKSGLEELTKRLKQ